VGVGDELSDREPDPHPAVEHPARTALGDPVHPDGIRTGEHVNPVPALAAAVDEVDPTAVVTIRLRSKRAPLPEKNATPWRAHWSRRSRTQSRSMGRWRVPLSPPQMTQEIPVRSTGPRGDSRGSTDTNLAAEGTWRSTGTRICHQCRLSALNPSMTLGSGSSTPAAASMSLRIARRVGVISLPGRPGPPACPGIAHHGGELRVTRRESMTPGRFDSTWYKWRWSAAITA
jgi:hypothetical protein